MFKWFCRKQIKKEPENKDIEKIINILFPALEMSKDSEGNQFQIDRSVDSNLDSVLRDLQEDINDAHVHNTLQNAINRLLEVRRLMGRYPEIHSDSKYIIVDDSAEGKF